MRLAAVVVTYRRPRLLAAVSAALRAQTRPADEVLIACEDASDVTAAVELDWGPNARVIGPIKVPFDAIPPSYVINYALDRTDADYITYVADDSLPAPRKFELMTAKLDQGFDVAYCSQSRGQAADEDEWLSFVGTAQGESNVHPATVPENDPYCKVDMSQVMHRASDLRWPLALEHRKIGDAVFFVALRDRFGAFEPVPEVLDWHRQLPSGITARW